MDKGRTQTDRPKDKDIDEGAKSTREDIERVYVIRKERRGLASVDDSVDVTFNNTRNTQKNQRKTN